MTTKKKIDMGIMRMRASLFEDQIMLNMTIDSGEPSEEEAAEIEAELGLIDEILNMIDTIEWYFDRKEGGDS